MAPWQRGPLHQAVNSTVEVTQHIKHPIEMALQERSPNPPLLQLILLFSDMGCVSSNETTLLAMRPAWRSSMVGNGCKAPCNTPFPSLAHAWGHSRSRRAVHAASDPLASDRCSRFLQSAQVLGAMLGQEHPFHYTITWWPASGSIARHSLPEAASA